MSILFKSRQQLQVKMAQCIAVTQCNKYTSETINVSNIVTLWNHLENIMGIGVFLFSQAKSRHPLQGLADCGPPLSIDKIWVLSYIKLLNPYICVLWSYLFIFK